MKKILSIKLLKTVAEWWLKRRYDRGETRAILDEHECNMFNEKLRDEIKYGKHYGGKNPTTRIDITSKVKK